jgi:hypothetical protein
MFPLEKNRYLDSYYVKGVLCQGGEAKNQPLKPVAGQEGYVRPTTLYLCFLLQSSYMFQQL